MSQFFGVSAHAGMMAEASVNTSEVSTPCHGSTDHQAENDEKTQLDGESLSDGSCCDDGCTMTGCHPANAIFSSSATSSAVNLDVSYFIVQFNFTSEPTSFLSRPPIIG